MRRGFRRPSRQGGSCDGNSRGGGGRAWWCRGLSHGGQILLLVLDRRIRCQVDLETCGHAFRQRTGLGLRQGWARVGFRQPLVERVRLAERVECHHLRHNHGHNRAAAKHSPVSPASGGRRRAGQPSHHLGDLPLGEVPYDPAVRRVDHQLLRRHHRSPRVHPMLELHERLQQQGAVNSHWCCSTLKAAVSHPITCTALSW